MSNKTQLFTTIGIMLLVIGASFLVGTIYRNNTYTSGGTIGNSPPGRNPIFMGPYSLSPRNFDVRLDFAYYDAMFHLDPVSSVDFYLLDSKGGELWLSDGVIEPVWFAKAVSPTETLHMKIPYRGDYFFLVINPDNSNIAGLMWPSLYGYESDLLLFSVIALVAGSIVTVVAKLGVQSKNKQPSTTISAEIKS